MRIAITMQSIRHLGGIGTYTQQLMRELMEHDYGHEYVLIFPSFGQAATVMQDYEGRGDMTVVLAKSLVPHGLYWDQVVVPGVVKKYGVDVFFNPFQSVPLRGKFRKVCTMHNSEWFIMPEVFGTIENLNGRFLLKPVLRAADHIISVSQKVADDLMAATGLPPERFTIIHNAAGDKFARIEDEATLADVRKKYALPRDFILFVGGIYPQKNFKGLLHAYQRIADRVPHKLVVAGNERWKSKDDVGLIDSLGLRERVQFLGWVENSDLPAIYRLTDCFAIPSFHESSSIALHEAFRCGAPVVASNTGGNPEVVGDAAPMVDPHDVEGLAAALERVVTSPELRVELTAKSLSRAKQFTWKLATAATLKVLEDVAR